MATSERTRLPLVAPKRTRNNVKQSKNGCFPCRAQRKKCDEGKPTCLRCARLKKKCEGFDDYALPPLATQTQHHAALSSPCRSLSLNLKTDSVQVRFVELGFEILHQQAHQDALGIGASVWTYLLPQLSSINPTVNAAIASLGATYEAVVLQPGHTARTGDSLAAVQYHKALASLRLDVLSQSHGPIPSFLASLLLAAVEVLSRHFTNALMHLHGAFTIMTECIHNPTRSPSVSSEETTPNGSEDSVLVDENPTLYLVAQALDIQTATYALSRRPQLPLSPFGSQKSAFNILSDSFSFHQAQSEIIPLLHACYHYTSIASDYKYVPRSEIPAGIALEQSRHIARLSQWLSKSDRRPSPSPDSNLNDQVGSPTTPHLPLLVERIQCISAIIYLTTILDYRERSYDALLSFFEQIVCDATVLLEMQPPGGCLTSPQNRFRFISPLSQPLYLTATKCRQGRIRRRAIYLLGLTGREGPWHGILNQKVAQRVMEIEEEHLIGENIDANSVTERMRLHGSGIESDGSHLPGRRLVKALFSRCVDAELMVTSSDVSWKSTECWEMWTERIVV